LLRQIAALSSGRRSKWAVVGFWIVLVAIFGPLSGKLSKVTEDRIAGWLPGSAKATQAGDVIQDRFPGHPVGSVVVVYTRAGGLTAADRGRIAADARAIAKVQHVLPPIPPFGPGAQGQVSRDGTTAFTVVQTSADRQQDVNEVVKNIRDLANGGDGLTVQVTGASALEADLNEAFKTADGTLVAVTVAFVLFLLLLIYRSPILALIPLVVVGLAYSIAGGIIKLLADSGLQVTSTSTSLLLVLMFGAGTDYCLLLVARYVEALRSHEDKHEAIGIAVRRAAPAIVASSGTVIVALLVMVFAELASTKALGPVDAIGVFIVACAGLTLLPALLAIVGRRGFWPSKRAAFAPDTPTVDLESAGSRWYRLGQVVTRRPRITIGAIVLVFLIGALGLTQYKSNASVVGTFLNSTEGTQGFKTLEAEFPKGALGPTTVVVARDDGPIRPADVAAAQAALKRVPEVGVMTPPTAKSTDGRAAIFDVLFPDDPYSNQALDRTDTMRGALASLPPNLKAYVGGVSAIQFDYRNAARHDTKLVVPLVLLVILLTLFVLLRSIVAPLLLVASVILSFCGIFGAAVLAFHAVPGRTAVDPNLPIFAFIFLVALGVDYNIFLMDRVREEAETHGTRRGALRALVATGPVITSAGVILAGTFAALSTIPIDVLVELGLTVAFGVIVDTLIVRSMLVPAMITVVGDRIWWPGRVRAHAESPPVAAPAQTRKVPS
jgi:RND superfamily putative drug exporter